MGGPTAHYHIALARVKLQKSELPEAEESLNEALQFDYQVGWINCTFHFNNTGILAKKLGCPKNIIMLKLNSYNFRKDSYQICFVKRTF